jgi:sugar/nucleoside kinase (ribokinase family)
VPAVFVGVATLDALALVDRYPDADERVLAGDVRFAGGGPAATAAVAAARLGLPVAFVGAVGADHEGTEILDGLAREGVDVSGVEIATDARSAMSVVLADRRRQTRAIAARPGPPLALTGHGAELVRHAEWVHVDHGGWFPVAALLRESSRRPRLSVDAGNPIDDFHPRGVDLYVPTVTSLRARYGEDLDEDRLLDNALNDGARAVIATDGGNGAIGADAGGRFRVPAYRADIVSTLGAGDVFHGALVAGVVLGLRLEDATRLATTTAALSCRALDGRSAIPTADELDPHLPDLTLSTRARRARRHDPVHM